MNSRTFRRRHNKAIRQAAFAPKGSKQAKLKALKKLVSDALSGKLDRAG